MSGVADDLPIVETEQKFSQFSTVLHVSAVGLFTALLQECERDSCHCSLARFSGGGLLGGAGAEDLVAGSLSSCLTVSVGGSGSFFTSTIRQEYKINGKLMEFGGVGLLFLLHLH